MARMNREDVFTPDEIAIVHVMNRGVRRCFLMGTSQDGTAKEPTEAELNMIRSSTLPSTRTACGSGPKEAVSPNAVRCLRLRATSSSSERLTIAR